MKVKRILVVYSGAKVWGGIETYLDNLFKFYDRKKLELVLVSLGCWELTEKLSKDKYKVIVLPVKRIRPRTISDIARLVASEEANLLVSQGVVANFYARKAAHKANVPLVTTIHSDLENEYPNELVKFLYRFSDRATRKYTTKFIAVSEFMKKRLTETGIVPEKISVVYNGVNGASFPEAKNQSSKKEITIGSVGRLHYVKGYHNLIEAMNYLKELPVKLVIYGEGEERKSLEELVQKNNLGEVVSLPGQEKDVDKIDIYVQSSLSEGFGLTVIEAMLAGKPVIVTPVGSLPEIVTDTKTGLITADTNPESLALTIKTLVKNPELAKELALAGQKEATEKFTIDKWIRETEKVYLETAR